MNTEKIVNDIKTLKDSYKVKASMEIGATSAESVLGVFDPALSGMLATFRTVANSADEIKLEQMIKGLASDNNREKRINEIYNFVKDSKEKAFLVSDLFRKTLLANTPIVCCIYGIILGDIMDDNCKLNYETMIVFSALQTATDYEIEFFLDIMHRCIKENGEINIEVITGENNTQFYDMVLQWGGNNRIFRIETSKFEDGVMSTGEFYYSTTRAILLLEYINQAKRLLYYENIEI